MSVAVTIRSNPIEGMEELKARLRDPWTTEALLLILDHPDVPDDVATERKEYASAWIKYIGVNVVTEVYSREDAREMIEMMHPEEDPEEVLDRLGVGVDDE
jgi:hypothetical protein